MPSPPAKSGGGHFFSGRPSVRCALTLFLMYLVKRYFNETGTGVVDTAEKVFKVRGQRAKVIFNNRLRIVILGYNSYSYSLGQRM